MTTNQIKTLLLCLAEDDSVSPQFIEPFILRYISGKPILPVTDFAYQFVVRCSPNNIGQGEVFGNVDRCSYNPKPEFIALQRCNYPKQQVFYAAVTSETKIVKASMTALMETAYGYVKNKSIDRFYFTLSKWKINRKLKMIVLPFSKRSHQNNFEFRRMKSEYRKLLKEAAKVYGKDYDEIEAFLVFMSRIFSTRSKRNKYYKVSSAFFNVVMSLNYEIDGLIYPSCMTKAEGMNVAIRKELIDNKVLEVDLAVMYAMQRNRSNVRNISFMIASTTAKPNIKGDLFFRHIY